MGTKRREAAVTGETKLAGNLIRESARMGRVAVLNTNVVAVQNPTTGAIIVQLKDVVGQPANQLLL